MFRDIPNFLAQSTQFVTKIENSRNGKYLRNSTKSTQRYLNKVERLSNSVSDCIKICIPFRKENQVNCNSEAKK